VVTQLSFLVALNENPSGQQPNSELAQQESCSEVLAVLPFGQQPNLVAAQPVKHSSSL
jgi:hypothetical protein